MAKSDVTPLMMGPPVFTDASIPTFEQFRADYTESFFAASGDGEGRSFIIGVGGDDVGHISYSNISRAHSLVELDIWMAGLEWCGHGYGPDALCALAQYLRHDHSFRRFLVRPSRRNRRSLAAYHRAGFNPVDPATALPESHRDRGDYDDALYLVREFDTT